MKSTKKATGNYEVVIKWWWEDVQSLRPDWSKEQCLKALRSVGRGLKDGSIEQGWILLEDLLDGEEEE